MSGREPVQVPAGPGDAVVLAVQPVLRQKLSAAGWNVRSVPAPAGDLAGLAAGAAPGSVDLVALDFVLSPLNHADKRAAIATVARWVRPDGQLLLREPVVTGADGTGWLARLRRLSGRLLRVSAEANHGPATVEFYLTGLGHVGFDATDPVHRDGEVVTINAHRRR